MDNKLQKTGNRAEAALKALRTRPTQPVPERQPRHEIYREQPPVYDYRAAMEGKTRYALDEACVETRVTDPSTGIITETRSIRRTVVSER